MSGDDPSWVRGLAESFRRDPTTPGECEHVKVLHDDWCLGLQTGNPYDCNCVPEIVRHAKGCCDLEES